MLSMAAFHGKRCLFIEHTGPVTRLNVQRPTYAENGQHIQKGKIIVMDDYLNGINDMHCAMYSNIKLQISNKKMQHNARKS